MTESTLSLTRDALLRSLGRFAGWGGDADNWTDEQQSWGDDILAAALRGFYAAHDWSFLEPAYQFSTTPAYATGTVEIVAGVATLTGGVWPTWAEQGLLLVDGGRYPIASRDGDAQMTLEDSSAAADAGSSHSLVRVAYDLPDDWGGQAAEFNFDSRELWQCPIQTIGESQLQNYLNGYQSSGRPRHAAVRPQRADGTSGQRWELLLAPAADRAYRLVTRYRVHPDALTGDAPMPYGGLTASEAIREAVLAVAESEMEDQAQGPHALKYAQALALAIRRDQRQGAPQTLGIVRDPSIEPGYDCTPCDHPTVRYVPGPY